jgi:hypothetical protein
MCKNKIESFWYNGPLSYLLQPLTEGDNCMACGIESTTDRAHIFAQVEGGSHQHNNIHLLCKNCHGESEMMEGFQYWAWLMVKKELYKEGYFTPYEMDYAVGEEDEIIKYFMEGMVKDKVTQHMDVVSKYLWLQDGLLFKPTLLKEIAEGNVRYSNFSVKKLLKSFFTVYLLPPSLKEKGEASFEEILKIDEWSHLHMHIGEVNA